MFTAEKFQSLPRYSDLKYKYMYDLTNRCWNVLEDFGVIASIDTHDPSVFTQSSGVVAKDLEILEDFSNFSKRPEWRLFNINDNEILTSVNLYDVYEKLLVGSVFLREISNDRNPDDSWKHVEKALNWLRTTDFYRAPASSRFHESFDGGLCFHSIKVAQRAIELMYSFKFCDESRIGSAVLCALTHDWCKIGLYEPYTKNVKNESTGVWEKERAFRYKGDAMINLGHGVSSMFLVSKFFKLSLEEASAIRWHMGAYRTDSNEFNELQSSNEQYPLCHLIQFADQLSLVKY